MSLELVKYVGTPQHLAHLKILCDAWQKEGFWELEDVLEVLAKHGTKLLIGHPKETSNDPAGAIFYRDIGCLADLIYIYLMPNCRRQGLAEELFTAMVEDLEDSGCERLVLEVRPGNSRAIALYQKMGMKQITVRRKYYKNGDDALIFQFDFPPT